MVTAAMGAPTTKAATTLSHAVLVRKSGTFRRYAPGRHGGCRERTQRVVRIVNCCQRSGGTLARMSSPCRHRLQRRRVRTGTVGDAFPGVGLKHPGAAPGGGLMNPGIIGPAVGLFAVTNIDDILVLALFFAQGAGQKATTRNIAAGQYLGFIAILVV